MIHPADVVGPVPLILVVDDEPAVRQLIRAVLVTAGFRVLLAGCVEEAAQILRQPGDEVAAVLIADYLLGMSGLQTLARLREASPGLPCGLMSDDPSKFAGDTLILQKPFPKEDLLTTVRALLADPGGAVR